VVKTGPSQVDEAGRGKIAPDTTCHDSGAVTDWLAAHLVDPLGLRFWAEVGLAILCGLLVGLERQLRGKPVGMRTSILICLGTMLFVRMGAGLETGQADPTRVLGQIVVGVGFLGGGVILTREGQVAGMTSAASVWMLAAVGSAIALGLHVMAVVVTIITLLVLVGLDWLQNGIRALRRGEHDDDRRS
jgi:putative Mg2+ transporter-C (MgtC) family protein